MSDEPKKRLRAWIGWACAVLLLPYLLGVVVLFSFVLGVCLTEAIVETFWPQWDNVIWIRLAGGSGIAIALIGLMTIRLRRLLSQQRAGTFICVVIAWEAFFILETVAAIWPRR